MGDGAVGGLALWVACLLTGAAAGHLASDSEAAGAAPPASPVAAIPFTDVIRVAHRSRDPADAEAAKLRIEVRSLRRDLAALGARLDEVLAARSAAVADDPEVDSHADEQHEATLDALAIALESEAVAPAWARETAAELREAFETPELGRVDLVDVECRSRRCRVEMVAGDVESMRSAGLSLAMAVQGRFSSLGFDNFVTMDGRPAAVVYLHDGS